MTKYILRMVGVFCILMVFTAFAYSAPAPLSLKFATACSADAVETKGLYYFKDLVEERTEGNVVIEVYTNGVLGNEGQLAAGIQMGTVDGIIIPSFKYSTYLPEMEFLNLPFLFTGEEHWRAAILGPVGEKFADLSYQRRGDLLLGFMTGGPRNIFSRKEIIGWAGFKGIKIRVMTVPSELLVWKALGVKPRAVANYDLTAALQTGLVDAAENNFINIKRMKYYEPPSQFILRTEHQITPILFLLGKPAYRKIPEEYREIVVSCGGEAAMWQVDQSFEKNEIVEKELINRYWVRVTELTYDEKAAWREKAASTHQQIAESLGLKETLKTVNSLVPPKPVDERREKDKQRKKERKEEED